jgi:hypothetical protein
VNVHVHIERLVLDGLTLGPGDAGRVRAEVEAELCRLLTGGGVSSHLVSGGALASVAAPAITLGPPGAPAGERSGALESGREIARSIYGGIGPRP